MTYSIIKKSELEGALRIDAEYYSISIPTNKKLINSGFKYLKDFIDEGYRAVYWNTSIIPREDMKKDDVFFLQSQDSENDLPFFKDEQIDGVWQKDWQRYPKGRARPGEILIEVKGQAEKVLLTPNDFSSKTLISGTFFKIKPKTLSPEYLFIYFLTKYGYVLRDRLKTNLLVSFINKEDLYHIPIFVASNDIQRICSEKYQASYKLYLNSKNFYSQAENLLLEELGLKNFEAEIKRELWSIVNLSETKKINRVDADYFQPKYQKLLSLIRANSGIALGELATIKKGFEPGSDAYQEEGKTFIRVSSISKDGVIDKDQKYLKEELYEKLKKDYQPKVGEILLTKDASPGVAYVVKETIEGIISGGVLRVKVKTDIEPEYLALVINSVVGKLQVERDAGGSVIMHWKPGQVKEMQIPILSKPIQQKIADLVQKSHEARKKAKELLEEAKKRVEELIENNQS